MTQTIEQKVAETILQKDNIVQVGTIHYRVAPPSIATLILASQYISKLPKIKLDDGRIVEESLRIARECKVIGDIVAILILGAKMANKNIISKLRYNNKRRRLAKKLLNNLTPNELYRLISDLLRHMEIGDFFGITTFLIDLNLTRPTKVVTETTASGQSSQDS